MFVSGRRIPSYVEQDKFKPTEKPGPGGQRNGGGWWPMVAPSGYLRTSSAHTDHTSTHRSDQRKHEEEKHRYGSLHNSARAVETHMSRDEVFKSEGHIMSEGENISKP